MNAELLREATQFIHLCYHELNKTESDISNRIADIEKSIAHSNTYEHSFEELEYGAKLAWRNSNRCIGRLFWNTLHVFDKRNLTDAQEICDSLYEHIDYATNQGKVRAAITIYRKEMNSEAPVRILNHQLIRYAGYETEHGIIGDSTSVSFTKRCQDLGWSGKGTHFDILPLVIQVQGSAPQWFEIPKNLVLEVPITHPRFGSFKSLDLKWYAVPIISSMRLEIGGISYCAAPFNGWYMGTEIGARNLADDNRYNVLPKVAERMDLDMSRQSSLWKDRALVELNEAVLYSYKEAGVSIVDHHTAAKQFKLFEEKEQTCGRSITGDWTWLIPPLSPAATHIFHQNYENKLLTPNFFYQEE